MKLWIYASIEDHDERSRRDFLDELKRLNILPIIHGDKVDFRYYGEKETVQELVELVDSHKAHNINVWRD